MTAHGRPSTYNAGCRCAPCRRATTAYMRQRRQQRMDSRALVDGRLVAPVATEKHGHDATYRNWGCRCVPCTEANTAHVRRFVDAKRGARLRVGDRLIAPAAEHGTSSSYRNHSCRCAPCCTAERAQRARTRERRAS